MDVLEEFRNWAELQPDVLSLIFQKLGAIEVLFTAQGVCSSWKQLSLEPQLWRRIDLWNTWVFPKIVYDLEKIARNAVDRSNGQLVEFYVEEIGTDELLQYIADRASALRCLRLVHCSITDEGIIDMAKKLPHLEELEISFCSVSKEALENVGQSCPQLNWLRLKCHAYKRPRIECDEEALAIAQNMPKLRRLQLFGNKLTDDGLRTILDSCPQLESLDLRACFSINLEGSLRKRCMDQLKIVKLPNDPVDDDEFDAMDVDGYGSYDEEYPSGFSEIDFLSDDEYYEFSDVDVFSFSDADVFSDFEF